MMSYLFISYSRQNKEFVQQLKNDLQAAGLTIWIDSVGLQPGTPDWDQALRDAIDESSAILLCASPSSRRSLYVRDEIALAKAASKPIYPLWIAGDDWLNCIPMGLGSTQHVDLRDESYAQNLPRLIGTLNGRNTTETVEPVEPITNEEANSEPVSNPRNPYKGLQAFRAEDRNDFFGREVLVEELVTFVDEKMQLARILAVLGASGSGKSSVMMAGLLPKLQEAHPDWLFLDPMVPGTHPLEKLTITLARQFKNKSQAAIREDLLDRSTRGLHRVACELSDKPIVFYIDQFEELFTLVDTEADRRHFIDLLTTAVTEPDGVLILFLSMRADFYDRPLQYNAFGKLIESQHVGITPMTLADLYDVVQKPAQLPDVGLQFEENLVMEMVFAVREEAAALPLLQFTLDQLFEQRDGNILTWQAYQEIGGIQGALAQHAEATYNNLPSKQHEQLARALFLRVIEPGQTEQETTRRRANYSELTLPDVEQTRILQETADAFVDARLLVSDQSDDTRTLEVSHEALIREWDQLGTWLHDARDDLRVQKSLIVNVNKWIQGGRKYDDDLLYRGSVLEEARDWENRNNPSKDEKQFISASVEAQRKQRQHELEMQQRATRRLWYLVGTMTMFLVVAIALSLWALEGQNIASDARKTADLEAATARSAEATSLHNARQASQLLLLSQSQRALQVYDDNLYGVAYMLALNVLSLLSPDAKVTDSIIQVLYGPGFQRVSESYSHPISGIVFHPEEESLLVIEESSDLKLISTNSNEVIRAFIGHTDWVQDAVFSPDGSSVVSGSRDTTVRIWDTQTGEEKQLYDLHTQTVNTVAYHPTADLVASGSEDGIIHLWNPETTLTTNILEGHTAGLNHVVFSPDGSILASASDDQTIRLWNVETGELSHLLIGHTRWIQRLNFNPDGTRLMSGSGDGSVRIWSTQQGELLHQLNEHDDWVTDVAYDANAKWVVSASNKGIIYVRDAVTNQLSITFQISHVITEIAFSPENTHLWTASSDGRILVWNLIDQSKLQSYAENTSAINDVAISSDETLIASAHFDNTIRLWNRTTGELLYELEGHDDPVLSVAFSADDRYLLSGSIDETMRLWDLSDRQILGTYTEHDDYVLDVAFGPAGESVISASADGIIRIFEIDKGELINSLNGHQGYVSRIEMTSDEMRLISVSRDSTIRIWNLQSGDEEKIIDTATSGIWSLDLSPDDTQVAIGTLTAQLQIWDVTTGTLSQQFLGHTDRINSVRFSPDGRTILSGSTDETMRLWDTQTSNQLRRIDTFNADVMAVQYADMDNVLIGASEDPAVQAWLNPSVAEAIEWIWTNRVPSDLSCEERLQYGVFPFCEDT